MPKIKKTIFREYDLRGRVSDDELTKENCKIIGVGFGSLLRKKGIDKIIVGFDAREYSVWIKDSLIEGLVSTGVNVVEIG